MKILYIFPHPDDESFGPSLGISAQRRAGHEVLLLTLTRGGATKVRHKLGYTVEKMGEVRFREMEEVAKVLGLSDLTVLDFPDSGLKEMDPRVLEAAVEEHIEKVRPQIVVTYAVHGISGFPDHIVAHAVVKRAYLSLKDRSADYLRRLAFYTVDQALAESAGRVHRIAFSRTEDIDCVVASDEEDAATFQRALDCYVTYQEMVEETGVREMGMRGAVYEIFGESFDPPLTDLVDRIP